MLIGVHVVTPFPSCCIPPSGHRQAHWEEKIRRRSSDCNDRANSQGTDKQSADHMAGQLAHPACRSDTVLLSSVWQGLAAAGCI